MSIISLIILAIGLAMDAFVVSITSGMNLKKVRRMYAIKIGLCFGIMQGIMPLIGYFLGNSFSKYIESVDHWIAFILLGILGGRMLYEAFKRKEDEEENINQELSNKTIIVMGIATSIDALAVGISLACLKANIVQAVVVIGVITFATSTIGVYIGKRFGDKFRNRAEILGGVILLLIGFKILLEHIGIF